MGGGGELGIRLEGEQCGDCVWEGGTRGCWSGGIRGVGVGGGFQGGGVEGGGGGYDVAGVVRWVGYKGEGYVGVRAGVRVVMRGFTWGTIFAIFFKISETGCVQEKLEKVEKTENYRKN